MAAVDSIPVGFLVMAALLPVMLTTTSPRACLVVLFEYRIIAIVVAIVTIVAPFFLLGLALRGGG